MGSFVHPFALLILLACWCAGIGAGHVKCRKGYRHQDGQCRDVNECSQLPRPCNQRCVNFAGGYRCLCYAGYSLARDGKTCIVTSKDVCLTYSGLCHYRCREALDPFAFQCKCPHGFELSFRGRRRRCRDINECENRNQCPSDKRCVNTFGSFLCLCPEGFRLETENNQRVCVDATVSRPHPCDDGSHGCHANANCIKAAGFALRCDCKRGYKGNGRNCEAFPPDGESDTTPSASPTNQISTEKQETSPPKVTTASPTEKQLTAPITPSQRDSFTLPVELTELPTFEATPSPTDNLVSGSGTIDPTVS